MLVGGGSGSQFSPCTSSWIVCGVDLSESSVGLPIYLALPITRPT